MNHSRSACLPKSLVEFWSDDLSTEQLNLLEEHLSVCELCQSKFEEQLNCQDVVPILNDSRDSLKSLNSSGFGWKCSHGTASKCGQHLATPLPQVLQEHTARKERLRVPSPDDGTTEHRMLEDAQQSLIEFAARWFPVAPEHPRASDGSDQDAFWLLAGCDSRTQESRESGLSERLLGTIEHYDLLEPIGSGGMGFVYKAFDRRLHRWVALKVLSPGMSATGAARQRFLREAQAAATIVSPHIVPIHAVGQHAGLPYLVMSLVDGPNLQQWINATGSLSIAHSLRIALQVATGLLTAHRQGIVHRDIKPGNILLQPSIMQASLTDFGLAQVADEASLTGSGVTPGTPSYMSPEQARGDSVDARSDWYSLGCVLYTMLIGHPPLRGPNVMAILSRLQQEEPKPPSFYRSEIPPWLDRLVLRFLQRDPAERLGEGEEVSRLLAACILHLENPSQCEVPSELDEIKNVPCIRINRKAVIVVALLALVGGVIASWSISNLLVSDSRTGTGLEGINGLVSPLQVSKYSEVHDVTELEPMMPQTTGSLNLPLEKDREQVIQAETQLRRQSIQQQEARVYQQIEQLQGDLTAFEARP